MDKPENFNQAAHSIAHEIADLVISKQLDYGPKNILNCPFGPVVGILVRMFDKLARIQNFVGKTQEPKNEKLENSWLDLMGYALIGLMLSRGVFELPIKQENE